MSKTPMTIGTIKQDSEGSRERYLGLQSQMIFLIEDMANAIGRCEDKSLRVRLEGGLRSLALLRVDSEFLAMGPDWSRYNMEENEVSKDQIDETIARLFSLETTA